SLRVFFFFQAEDGIRDRNVTGVQTCALPIFGQLAHGEYSSVAGRLLLAADLLREQQAPQFSGGFSARPPDLSGQLLEHTEELAEIGRASCRERVEMSMVGGAISETLEAQERA